VSKNIRRIILNIIKEQEKKKLWKRKDELDKEKKKHKKKRITRNKTKYPYFLKRY
jgi:hypothetical protein